MSLEPGYPAAARLLLRCLSPNPTRPAAVGTDSPGDWHTAAELALRHELAPLFFRRLKQLNAQALVPPGTWERLREAFFACAKRNTHMYRRLGPVLAGLRSRGIPVIVLKGAYLAEVVYRDITLRPMADVDLLVPKTELARARTALFEAGASHWPLDLEDCCGVSHQVGGFYFTRTAQENKCNGPETVRTDSRFSAPGRQPRGAPVLAIELHWAIEKPTCPFKIPIAGLWDRSRPARIAGVEVRALSPEDFLLNLCLHSAYRDALGTGLRPVCDTALLVGHHLAELDWPQLADRAHAWNTARYVGLALALARDLLAAGVPDAVTKELTPGGIDPRLLATARDCVLAQAPYNKMLPAPLNRLFGVRPLKQRLMGFEYQLKVRRKLPRSRIVRLLLAAGMVLLAPFLAAFRLWSLILVRYIRGLPVPAYRRQIALGSWLRKGARPCHPAADV